MDLKAHIQAARRAPPNAPMPRPEPRGPEIGPARRRSIERAETLSVAVAASTAALALLCLAT